MPSEPFAAEAERIRQRVMDTLLSAFSELSEGLLIVDREARIVWMNEQYPRHLGFSDPAEAIGKPVEEVIPNSLMRTVVTTGRPIMLDIMEFGSESFVVMRLPVRDEQDQVIGGVGVVVFDDARQLAPVMSRFQSLRHELADTRRKLDEARRAKYTFACFVGGSAPCLAVKNQARRAARSLAPVLIIGETGTGKELLAQAIHSASPRAGGPFVAVNIAAVPETLLEAEFFGVAPGAYTGADRKGRAGKFELAQGGTLFLDEIGDMSPALQAKLLRALQEKEIEPVGSNRLVSVDVRIIAATSRRLQEEVEAGRFRADLFYRLNVMNLQVPPLRERLDDLPAIAESLADSIARRLGEPLRSVDADALALLARHDWPGNVRELSNVLERALLMSDADRLSRDDFASILPDLVAHPAPAATSSGAGRPRTLEAIHQDAERNAILSAISAAGGNKAQAARNLGISRASLYEKISALGIAGGA